MDILPWTGPIDLSLLIDQALLFLQIDPVGIFLQIGQALLSLGIDLIDPFLCPSARASHAFASIVRD